MARGEMTLQLKFGSNEPPPKGMQRRRVNFQERGFRQQMNFWKGLELAMQYAGSDWR